MIQEKGSLSIQTGNIFPIIKKWLYSEKDIFIRELISNSADAISKLKKLSDMGEAKLEDGFTPRIEVILDKDNGTISIDDNGIGMTAEEVKKYINQIAFSGAKDFIEKYHDKTDDQQIIGHFGLGFYSAFMVAERVYIDTLSYTDGAEAVRWESGGDADYSMEASSRKERGTRVTLKLDKDSQEFLDPWKLKDIITKYFQFLQYEIWFKELPEKDGKKDEKPLNDTSPLWLKNPRDCTDDEYKKFYHKVFTDFNDPLFWIHINMDYPFRLKGIIYFPKLRHEFDTLEGKIKLYYNQVFVADNIKEVIPEFLLLLKGCLDCPDLPLNVSRSYLQSEGYAQKISNHITKKVADKLQLLFKKDREGYNKYWDDINPFVKYGCIREEKFYGRIKDILIYKTIHDRYVTLEEYLEPQEGREEKKVYYVSDEKQQAQYVRMFKDNNMDAVILDSLIDTHFISFMESKLEKVKFLGVDADISGDMKDDGKELDEKEKKKILEESEKIFRQATSKSGLKVNAESLKNETIPAIMLLSEESRRFREMARNFGRNFDADLFPGDETLVLNINNPVVSSIIKLYGDESRKADVLLAASYIYDLAVLNHRRLDPESMVRFIEKSNDILGRLIKTEEEAK
ncbi:MAG: molecular chaperone HtpG [Clostridiaceae bacterium]|nr:molecular chaperone HtpG [Clostridiaceae bacterium]